MTHLADRYVSGIKYTIEINRNKQTKSASVRKLTILDMRFLKGLWMNMNMLVRMLDMVNIGNTKSGREERIGMVIAKTSLRKYLNKISETPNLLVFSMPR
jgi:hypothetical protein